MLSVLVSNHPGNLGLDACFPDHGAHFRLAEKSTEYSRLPGIEGHHTKMSIARVIISSFFIVVAYGVFATFELSFELVTSSR